FLALLSALMDRLDAFPATSLSKLDLVIQVVAALVYLLVMLLGLTFVLTGSLLVLTILLVFAALLFALVVAPASTDLRQAHMLDFSEPMGRNIRRSDGRLTEVNSVISAAVLMVTCAYISALSVEFLVALWLFNSSNAGAILSTVLFPFLGWL